MMDNDLLIIVPCYNEQDNIVGLIEKLEIEYPLYDYVVINDGSTDKTRQLLK